MAKKPNKKSRNNSTVSTLAIISAIIGLLSNLIGLIIKLIDLLNK